MQASPNRAAYATDNETAKIEWVDNVLINVQGYFADGINMDTEDDIAPMNKTVQKGLTDMAVRAKKAFVDNDLSDVKVTFDIGWSPNVDGRFYDYEGLAAASDFLIIMAYDMASYIWGACLATPNSPPPQVLQGLLQWISVTTPDKLVIAVPWYGRSYTCAEGTKVTDRYCPLAASPWRDCNCTDATSGVLDYTSPHDSNLTKMDDEIMQSSYYNDVDVNGTVTQYWPETIESLRIKYAYVNDYDLKGIGLWTPNFVSYGDSPHNDSSKVPDSTWEMWKAINTIPFGR